MRAYIFFLIMSLIVLSTCEKIEEHDSLNSTSKKLVSIKEDNHLVYTFKYDSMGRLIRLYKYHADTVSLCECYEYNSDNNIIKRTFGDYIETYEYDQYGKLKTTIKYYEPTDKEWKINYEYDKDQISRGITFFNDSESGYIEFKYDSSGNTIERTEYSNWPEQMNLINSHFKLRYDNKINPVKNLNRFPNDMMQNNNPIYYYYYSCTMSMYPLEIYSIYDYDIDGYPVKQYIGTQIYYYEYVNKRIKNNL